MSIQSVEPIEIILSIYRESQRIETWELLLGVISVILPLCSSDFSLILCKQNLFDSLFSPFHSLSLSGRNQILSILNEMVSISNQGLSEQDNRTFASLFDDGDDLHSISTSSKQILESKPSSILLVAESMRMLVKQKKLPKSDIRAAGVIRRISKFIVSPVDSVPISMDDMERERCVSVLLDQNYTIKDEWDNETKAREIKICLLKNVLELLDLLLFDNLRSQIHFRERLLGNV